MYILIIITHVYQLDYDLIYVAETHEKTHSPHSQCFHTQLRF